MRMTRCGNLVFGTSDSTSFAKLLQETVDILLADIKRTVRYASGPLRSRAPSYVQIGHETFRTRRSSITSKPPSCQFPSDFLCIDEGRAPVSESVSVRGRGIIVHVPRS